MDALMQIGRRDIFFLIGAWQVEPRSMPANDVIDSPLMGEADNVADFSHKLRP